MTRALLRRLLAFVLVAAAAGFLTYAIVTQWQALREHEWRVDLPLMALSLTAHVAVLAWGVVVWRAVVLRFAAEPVALRVLLRVWFLSSLARYIPGKVFQFIAVAQLSRGAGVSAGLMLSSLLVHTGLALLAAGVVAAWTLGEIVAPGVPVAVLWAASAAVAVLLVHPALLNRALGLVATVARREVAGWKGAWGDGVLLLSLSIVSWLFYGVAYFLFLASLTPLSAATLPALSGINALSFVAGYLAIVTPGGLGVREAAMTTLLLPLLPRSVAALLAIASRLWTIAAEILGGALVLALFRPPTPAEGPADAAAGAGADPAETPR